MTATTGYLQRDREFLSRWAELYVSVLTQATRDARLGDRQAAAFVAEVEDGLIRPRAGDEAPSASATLHRNHRRS